MNQKSTSSKDLLFESRDGIGRVTFNRPQARNALTFEMYELLAQICHQANNDRSIKILVLQVAGDKAFASGTDINQFRAFTRLPTRLSNMNPAWTECSPNSSNAACPRSPAFVPAVALA
jgi:enoyl-CoA hydratase/carnithine racemase